MLPFLQIISDLHYHLMNYKHRLLELSSATHGANYFPQNLGSSALDGDYDTFTP